MNEPARMQLNPFDPDKWMLQAPQALGATSAAEALYVYLRSLPLPEATKALELGSGSGVISIMLALACPEWKLTGIEIQQELWKISQENAAALQLPLNFIHADLRTFTDVNAFNLIFSNPPWQVAGAGLVSPNPLRAISRTELSCSMEDVFQCLSRNLMPGGEAVLLYPSSRVQEAQNKASGLSLKKLTETPPHWSIMHYSKG